MPQTHFRRNISIMSACQALSMSGSVMVFAIVALAGRILAPSPELATLPLGIQFVAMMAATVPASLVMGRWGRRVGFTLGQGIGLAGALLAAWALLSGSFVLFVVASVAVGIHTAFFQFLRHAAAETAPEPLRPKAISYVMAGGVVAALLGPELAKRTAEALPVMFAGPYLAMAALCVLNIMALQFIRMPRPQRRLGGPGGRGAAEILRDPVFLTAALAAMIGYGVMNLVMVATPLAMAGCGFTFGESADVIRWHVLGMFVPSFFTGDLIRRFGVLRVIGTGAALLALSLGVNLSGTQYAHFWVALLLLGIGWNFMFIGATALLAETHRPEERARVQGLNDLMVFSTTAVTSFASGAVQNSMGWQAVNAVSLLPVLLAFAMVVWLARKRLTPQ